MSTGKGARRCVTLAAAALCMGLATPTWAQTSPEEADLEQVDPMRSPEFLLANISQVSPFNLIHVVVAEWRAGNKLKAAFWYYIWQIRTDAWVEGGGDSGFKLLRDMMSNDVSEVITPWIAADPALWQDTTERAISYEAKLPLWTTIPDEMSQAEWMAIVAKTRADYALEMQSALAKTSPEELRIAREQNGLYVGTPEDLGDPLPEDWR